MINLDSPRGIPLSTRDPQLSGVIYLEQVNFQSRGKVRQPFSSLTLLMGDHGSSSTHDAGVNTNISATSDFSYTVHDPPPAYTTMTDATTDPARAISQSPFNYGTVNPWADDPPQNRNRRVELDLRQRVFQIVCV